MANIREALANGLDDIAWANEQLRALKEQRAELEQAVTLVGDPPQIDAQQAQVYRQKLEETLAKGTPASRRAMLRECVAEVRLFPDTLEVEAAYLLPVAAIKNGSRILRSQSR